MGAHLPTVMSGEPLLSYIRRDLDSDGRLPDHLDLPDEVTIADTELRWAPGARRRHGL